MKLGFPVLSSRAASVAGALVVACILVRGGDVSAQGGESTEGEGVVRMIMIDEPLMTTGENARRSQRIVWARCLSVEVRQLRRANIETYIEFEILEALKGTFPRGRQPGTHFTVVIPEGRVGDFKSVANPPFPKFKPGDEVVLLIGPDRPQGLPGAVISPNQSTYWVYSDAQGHKTVSPRPTGMTIYRSADGRAYERAPGRVSVEDFLYSLREHVPGR